MNSISEGAERATSGNGLAQCEMYSNGLADYIEPIDGDDVHLCSSCHRLLEESGRLGDRGEVPA